VQRQSPGEVVAIQEFWRGRLWAARPVVVVRDDSDLLVLWCPRGTRWKVAATPPDRQGPLDRSSWYADLLTRGDWVLADSVWRTPTLWLVREHEWHAVWVSPDDGGTRADWRWYVNFQEPFVRTPSGIRATDLMLDIVIGPDRSWRWKDENDFDALMVTGLLDETVAARVRADGERVVKQIENEEFPFDGSWLEWQPDPGWPSPELPPGWDRE
jgi:protein associated with RNAse G/E